MQIFILDENYLTLCALSNKNSNVDTFVFYDSKFTSNIKTPPTFEFSCPMTNANSKNVIVGNKVIFKFKNKFHLFNITEIEETHSNIHAVRCYCEGVSLELLNNVVLPSESGSVTLNQALEIILATTDWQIGKIPDNMELKTFELSSYATALEEIQSLAETFDYNIDYRVEYEPRLGVTGKYIDMYENVGKLTGIRFEYGVNTTDVTKTVNNDNVCTAVIPVGNNEANITGIECTVGTHGFNKPNGQAYVCLSDEERMQVTSSPYHIFTKIDCDTEDLYAMAKLAWEHLQDNKTPKIDYTFNPAKLDANIDIGDSVYCIDREMGLQLSAIVSELSFCFEDASQDEVTLTNFVEVISGIDNDLVKQIQNQLKDLDIDSNVIISPEKPDVELDVPIVWIPTIDGDVNSGVNLGDINIWTGDEWIGSTDRIESDLKDWVLENGEMKILFQAVEPADVQDGQIWIDSSTQPYVWKRWNAETLEWEILFETEEALDAYTKVEVDQIVDEINGVIANKISKTELDPITEKLTLHDTKFEQTTTEISSKVSKDEYDLDLDAMKARLETAETSIIQNAESITSKASKTELDDLTGTVNTFDSRIEQNATAITSKVSAGDIASSINQTAQSVTISASKINFNGASSYGSSNGTVTINNGYVQSSDPSGLPYAILSKGNLQVSEGSGVATSVEADGINFYDDSGSRIGYVTCNANGEVSISGWENVSGEGFTDVQVLGSGNAFTSVGVSSDGKTLYLNRDSSFLEDTYLDCTATTLYAPEIIRVDGIQCFYFSGSGITLASNNYTTFIAGSAIYSTKSIQVSSDINKKENIVNVNDDDFADFVLGIDLVEYNYIDDPNKEKYVGAIAQQVQAIDPTVSQYYVDENPEDGSLGIKESALVYPIIATLKRQQKQIEDQEERIAKLEAMVEALMNK